MTLRVDSTDREAGIASAPAALAKTSKLANPVSGKIEDLVSNRTRPHELARSPAPSLTRARASTSELGELSAH
jgi:hypothetical protein